MTDILLMLFGAVIASTLIWAVRAGLGFRAQSPSDYRNASREFDIRKHLTGPMICEGVIFGPTGRVVSRFRADIVTTWDGDRGVMAETFHYDSGATQDRAWHLEVQGDGKIVGQAEDVIGTADGQQTGDSVLLRYRIRLPEDAGGHILSATDWMYLLGNGTIVNRSQFLKHGIRVAELVATMRRKDES